VSTELQTVRFGRRQSKGVLLGLSGLRVTVIAAALAVLVPALFLAGPAGVVVTAPVVLLLLASAFVPAAGRTAIEWAPVTAHWALRRFTGQDIYGVRPSRPRPVGTLALPGDSAALRVHVDAPTGAAMIHDPHRHTLTVVARVSHPAFVLLGAAEQQRRVTAWGRVLAMLAGTGQTAAVQVLETTVPDSGTEILSYWQTEGRHEGSWTSRNYADFVKAAAPASARHTTTISLSLDLKRAARQVRNAGRGLPGAASVLRQDMTTLGSALHAADLKVEAWLDPAALAHLIRAAYDPDGAARTDPYPVGRDLATAGPVGIDEQWDHFTTDSAVTAVLWISEWPRSEVYPNFLHTLILKAGVRKTFSLVAHPVPTREAIRTIRKQKVDYVTDAQQKARIGQIADFAGAQEYEDLLERERELIAGHADLRFAGFLAVTAPTLDDLAVAVAEVERTAIGCGCETRRLGGQQTQAFIAAALPFGRGL
jgi:hypothetical protein